MQQHTPPRHPALALSTTVTANPSSYTTSSANWSCLPIEMLSIVVSYMSFRDMLQIAAIDRRMHRLTADDSRVWRHYPPVTCAT